VPCVPYEDKRQQERDTIDRWAEGAKVQEVKELTEELGDAMRAYGRDPAPIREATGD
jgi:hypothetical protein